MIVKKLQFYCSLANKHFKTITSFSCIAWKAINEKKKASKTREENKVRERSKKNNH